MAHVEAAMTIEQQFRAFVAHLREQGIRNVQGHVAHLETVDVPEQFRSAFSFWRSLAGPSRNLMLDVAQGHRTRKSY